MTRTDEAKRMLDETKLELERKNHLRVVELCDKLLADYSDVINVPGVQDTRAAELCKLGRFAEAEPVFREFMQTHKKLGMPIASTTWMYHWLICYYKGDERKSMDQFVALDEARAVALLNQGDAAEPTRGTGPEKPVGNQKEARSGSPMDYHESNTDSPDAWFAGLDDADGLKRAECAIRIGKRKNANAVDKLIAVLRSEGTLFAQAALSQALGRIGDKRALPVLRKTLRALIRDELSKFVLVAWSTIGTQANVLPEAFSDLDEDVDYLYSCEKSALQADAGFARQIHKCLVGVSRREYVFRSVLTSVAQLGERADIADITPFLTWTWEDQAFLEPHTCAADALTILLDRLPADESWYDELEQLKTSVLGSKEHAAKQGWHTEAHTNKTLAAIGRKRHAIRKQMRTRLPTWRERVWDWVKQSLGVG